MINDRQHMVIARVRLDNNGDKSIVNKEFTDLSAAQTWCTTFIGVAGDRGVIEFIGLTDYSTMHYEEFEI